MPPSEIRKEAREALKGKWGKAVLIILAFLAFSMFISFVQSFVNEDSIVYTLLDVAFLIINVPLSFGLVISFIKLKRSETVSAFDFIKEGFTRFGKAWGIGLHIFIRLLLPILCLVLVLLLMLSLGIVNALTQSNFILILLSVAFFIFTVVYAACRVFLYVIAYNLCYDNPELSAKECVLKSAEYMKGHRGNYFMLELSFIGWAILAAFSMGIGVLWLIPYMQVAAVCFYERVLKNKEIKQAEPAEKVEK